MSSNKDKVKEYDNAAKAKFAFVLIPGSEREYTCELCPNPENNKPKKTYTQNKSSGYGNLITHLNVAHTDINDLMRNQDKLKLTSGPLDKFISRKAMSIYGWIDFCVTKSLPFTICEDDCFRKYTNIENICYKTLMKYCHAVSNVVETKISEKLKQPDMKFGIMIDGWDAGGGTHYTGLFIIFQNKAEYLLAMSPLSDETNFTAANQKAFIVKTFIDLGISEEELKARLLFLSGDNAEVNKAIANLLSVPHIGCNSHRLNLGVEKLLDEHSATLHTINTLMGKLSQLKNHGLLTQLSDLEPIQRNKTRWSSAYEMLKRFHDFVDADVFNAANNSKWFNNVTDSIPSARECRAIKALYEKLKIVESVTKQLQGEGMKAPTHYEVRLLFDALIDEFPLLADSLSSEADIVHRPALETALVKIQSSCDSNDLETDELAAMQPFKRPLLVVNATEVVTGQAVANPSNFAEEIIGRAKRLKLAAAGEYIDLSFIPTTSCKVERLFSRAKLNLSDLRKSMLPSNLEMLMYLHMNKTLWDIQTVASILASANVE